MVCFFKILKNEGQISELRLSVFLRSPSPLLHISLSNIILCQQFGSCSCLVSNCDSPIRLRHSAPPLLPLKKTGFPALPE